MKTADPATTSYVYITAGDRDPMLDQVRRLAGVLEKRGFASELHVMPGGHDWTEWNAQVPGCFGKLIDVVKGAGSRE